MSDGDGFKCDKCETQYTIAELEMWEVYEEDGKQTEFICNNCDASLTISSSITGWTFEAEADED